MKIAVVRQLNTGDVYQEWIQGVKDQAAISNVELTIYDANGDNAKQALDLDQAVASNPDGILIGWGFGDTLAKGIEDARAAGIPVTSYYVQTTPGNGVATVNQGDDGMMQGILDAMKADVGDAADILYVYVPGYEALDNRNKVWEAFSAENPGITVKATIGVVNSNTAAQVADQAKAALQANPDVKAILAPYDEFAKGATLAVKELGLEGQVKVYGMDISTADIAVMTEPNSPWVLTATTDQRNVGAVALRTNLLMVADMPHEDAVIVPGTLISSADLVSAGTKNVDQLAAAIPGLTTAEISPLPWLASK